MRYSRARIEAFGYELAPVVVSSAELEERLAPLYERLRIPAGQLEALTGVQERRWWEPGFRVSVGAVAAAKKALAGSNVLPGDLGALVYAGVCREHFEPATACHVAAEVGVREDAAVYDVSNACLGVLNGIVDVANRIELGQIRAGLVVACETAREITDVMIEKMLATPTMDTFRTALATCTGGSSAVAVLVTDGSFGTREGRRLLGAANLTDPSHHWLCRWGLSEIAPGALQHFMSTDSVQVLKHGVELGKRTWKAFLERLDWARGQVDRVICHQVGSAHRETILSSLGIDAVRDFPTFPFLGNMGTVSLPLTAALAEERGFLERGQKVGFLGIGSGLNCLMLGFEW